MYIFFVGMYDQQYTEQFQAEKMCSKREAMEHQWISNRSWKEINLRRKNKTSVKAKRITGKQWVGGQGKMQQQQQQSEASVMAQQRNGEED